MNEIRFNTDCTPIDESHRCSDEDNVASLQREAENFMASAESPKDLRKALFHAREIRSELKSMGEGGKANDLKREMNRQRVRLQGMESQSIHGRQNTHQKAKQLTDTVKAELGRYQIPTAGPFSPENAITSKQADAMNDLQNQFIRTDWSNSAEFELCSPKTKERIGSSEWAKSEMAFDSGRTDCFGDVADSSKAANGAELRAEVEQLRANLGRAMDVEIPTFNPTPGDSDVELSPADQQKLTAEIVAESAKTIKEASANKTGLSEFEAIKDDVRQQTAEALRGLEGLDFGGLI